MTSSAWQTGTVTSHDTPSPASGSPFRSGPTDRDQAPQFVLPLVLHLEKTDPPARTDALRAAARAVLTILSDERSHGDGAWAAAMRDWQDARIRKVVRRARGAEWRKAAALDGITVTGEDAVVARTTSYTAVTLWPARITSASPSSQRRRTSRAPRLSWPTSR